MRNISLATVHVVLVHPEIAPNTGNIIRLCANVGADLHLVEPLGFSLDDRLLKRGGLDYHELTSLTVHASFDAAVRTLRGHRLFTFASAGDRSYAEVEYRDDDVLIFGAERAGLDTEVVEQVSEDHRLTIPMRPGNRSLNLANAVSVVVYEAWRQQGFGGAGESGPLTSETPSAPPFDR